MNVKLLLEFESDPWEEKCERCKGEGKLLDDVPPYYGATAVIDCWKCHGTGVRRMRLEGAVEVTITSDGMTRDGKNIIHSRMVVEDTNAKLVALASYKKELADKIIAAYRNGTLPAAVRANLREVDVNE